MFEKLSHESIGYSLIEKPHKNGKRYLSHFVVAGGLLLVSITFNIFLFLTSRDQPVSHALYSPAQNVLRESTVLFEHGFGLNSTPYSGPPSPESDAAWQELYEMGISRISVDEAKPMTNMTLPIPGDEDHYIVQLSVFHLLHCLNQIRIALHTGYNPDDLHFQGKLHVDHCISAIRQSLMCSADVTPLTWGRDRESGSAKVLMNVQHTCRDFDAIRDWANQHTMKVKFDWNKEVFNDPLGYGQFFIQDYGIEPATHG